MTITASGFKAKCLGLMDHVRKSGESITITKRGVEVARLVPPAARQQPWERLRGTGRLLASPEESFFFDSDFDAFTGRELAHRQRQRPRKRR